VPNVVRPTSSSPRARSTRPAAAAAALGVLVLALSSCLHVEEVTRSAAEQSARDAVAQITAGAGDAAAEAAREQAQGAVDTALDQLPGTCADVIDLPKAVRHDQAEQVLRGFWLAELTTADPPAEAVEQFEAAVVAACRDSRETEASVVLREVWQTGEHTP
jgi:hypothetical protein